MKIAVLGNSLPRRCGIATFTDNLINSLIRNQYIPEGKHEVFVIAMNDNDKTYDYPELVRLSVRQQEQQDYIRAAAYVNASHADLCLVQHEFGIYGGESGAFLLSFIEALQVPVVTTLHTILKTPSFHEKHILKRLGEKSERLVVMSRKAITFLTDIYQIPEEKVAYIPHGVPDFSNTRPTQSLKKQYPGRKILCTFGLLGRSKGIETVIRALASLKKQHTDFIYLVIGKTHPNVLRDCGEEYRDSLKALIREKQLEDHVAFIDRFLSEEELKDHLLDVDIYITPYLNEAQITSGTLCYAVGAGTCVISTPYWHASEMLAEDRGQLFGFSDSRELAHILLERFSQPTQTGALRANAFTYGQNLYWDKIGKRYEALLQEVVSTAVVEKEKTTQPLVLPEFNLRHLSRLTDHMGIIEHASFNIPLYREGYCLDDNARALLMTLYAAKQGFGEAVLKYTDIYLRFINLLTKDDGTFYNEYSVDHRVLITENNEEAFGRTLWALGYMVENPPAEAYFQHARDLFNRCLPNIGKLRSLRARAQSLIGLCYYLNRFPDHDRIRKMVTGLADSIIREYNDTATDGWNWFEPILCYDNALLPLSLWHTYAITKNKDVKKVALESMLFLESKTFDGQKLSLIGNEKWYRKDGERSQFAQQPIDALSMVLLYQKVYEVTGKPVYKERMKQSFTWFTGNNDLQIPLLDEETGGCCDGIEARGINRNQGAESCLSYLLSFLTVRKEMLIAKRSQKGIQSSVHNISGTATAFVPEKKAV